MHISELTTTIALSLKHSVYLVIQDVAVWEDGTIYITSDGVVYTLRIEQDD